MCLVLFDIFTSKLFFPVFSSEAKTFSFKTAYFGTMALLQDAHINMPFQSWEIRPHKTNTAVFSIIAAIIEIEIEIKVWYYNGQSSFNFINSTYCNSRYKCFNPF